MSPRTDIRTALQTVIQTLEGISSASVLIGRHRSIPPAKLPAICIYTETEEKQTAAIGHPREIDRQFSAQIEIHLRATTPAEAETGLDAWCEKLETALLADESLGGLTREIIPQSDQYMISEEGERPAAVALCQYLVVYDC